MIIENAGVHFKTGRTLASGADFIQEFADRWITETLVSVSGAKTLVICNEKYHFTPDAFKSATLSTLEDELISMILSDFKCMKPKPSSLQEDQLAISGAIQQQAEKAERDTVLHDIGALYAAPQD